MFKRCQFAFMKMPSEHYILSECQVCLQTLGSEPSQLSAEHIVVVFLMSVKIVYTKGVCHL